MAPVSAATQCARACLGDELRMRLERKSTLECGTNGATSRERVCYTQAPCQR